MVVKDKEKSSLSEEIVKPELFGDESAIDEEDYEDEIDLDDDELNLPDEYGNGLEDNYDDDMGGDF